MKKWIAKLLIVVLILTLFTPSMTLAFAAGDTLTVDIPVLNVRDGVWGTWINQIYQGSTFEILDSAKDKDGITWYQITVEGKQGWVYGGHVTLNESAQSSKEGVGKVNYEAVYLRTSPWGNILDLIYQGTEVKVLGSQKDNDSNNWYKVEVAGQTGFMYAEYIDLTSSSSSSSTSTSTPKKSDESLTGSITVTWDFARVRTSPWGTILGQINRGGTAEVTGKTRDSDGATWYQVKFDGNTGYMHEENVSYSASSTPTTSTTPSVKDEKLSGSITVTWNFARVRTSPWGAILGQINRGGTAEVTGKTRDSDGATWYQVKFDGKTGYMHEENVRYSTSTSSTPKPSTPNNKDTALSGSITVTYTFARVRSTPWGAILGQINRGGKAEVTGKTTDSDGATWYQVKYDGKTGYMHEENVSFSATSSTPTTPSTPSTKDENLKGTLTITWNFARVRSTPWGAILGQINRGGKAEVIGKTSDNDGATWYKVKFDGKTGYMHAENVSFSATPSTPSTPTAPSTPGTKEETLNGSLTVTWNFARVRQEPWGTVLGQINRGQTAEVVGRTKDSSGDVWFKVKYNGSFGYMHEGNVEFKASASTPTPSKPETPKGTLRVNYPVLNVRKSPTTSSAIVATIKDLTVHNYSDSKRDSRGDLWYKIPQGWVHGDYVDLGTQKVTGIDIVLSTVEYTGNPIEITALAQGSNRALYKISIKEGSSYKLLKDFSAERNAIFTPVAEGSYTIRVEAKDIQASTTEKVFEESFTLKKNLSPHSYQTVKYGSLEEFAKAQVGRAVKWKDGYWVNATYEEILAEMNPQTALTFDLPKVSPSPITNIRITGTVNVRTGAGTNHPSMGYAEPGEEYQILGTTKVNGATWYQVTFNRKAGWLHSDFAMDASQGIKSPEARLGDFVTIISNGTPLRKSASTSASVLSYLAKNSSYLVLDRSGSWMKVQHNGNAGWIQTSAAFGTDEVNESMYQFLDLRGGTGISSVDLNRVLSGKGILTDQGAAFVEASKLHNINEIYLVSHALLETGNGSSELATGVVYNGVKVYNMYGIGAYDQDPVGLGAKAAYENGWTTPEKAIIDGAKWISTRYVHNSDGQNTLYKMRYNYLNPSHQYATDITWARAQTSQIRNLYSMIQNYNLRFEVPVYVMN